MLWCHGAMVVGRACGGARSIWADIWAQIRRQNSVADRFSQIGRKTERRPKFVSGSRHLFLIKCHAAGPHRSSRHSSPCVYPSTPSSSPRPPQLTATVPIVIDAQLPGLSPLPASLPFPVEHRARLDRPIPSQCSQQPAAALLVTPLPRSERISRTEQPQPQTARGWSTVAARRAGLNHRDVEPPCSSCV